MSSPDILFIVLFLKIVLILISMKWLSMVLICIFLTTNNIMVFRLLSVFPGHGVIFGENVSSNISWFSKMEKQNSPAL